MIVMLGERRVRAIRDMARFCVAMLMAGVLLHVSHVGCPIKFVTGVSCPGCGMTRAWLSVVHGDVHQAVAYHPLFWTVPFVMALVIADPGVRSPWARTAVVLLVLVFVTVWLIRLLLPHDALILTGANYGPDYISAELPVWLQWILSRQ